MPSNNCLFLHFYLDYRLAKIYIYTSNVSSPKLPSTSSPDWTLRDYRKEPYGAVGIIDLNQPIEAQHVAVISTLTGASLTLAEVAIYGLILYF